MKYIKARDYEYIINKYHDTTKPFDPFTRFIRRDEIFSADTGMAPDDILSGLAENEKCNKALPRPVRKALAL